MNKLCLFRMLIVSFLVCLIIWDGLGLLFNSTHTLPVQHRQLFLVGAFLWIAAVFINQNSNDDDWAGQL
jgi:hypothetical protein